jgi:anaerobic C4-dicarboxylate transporter
MDWRLILEFLVIVGALAMGARMGDVGLGLWGAVGLLVLVVGFDVAPAIAIVMLAVAAIILTVTKAPVADVPKCKTCQSGITAIVGILGLAWLGDTFINANREAIIGGLSAMATAAPWTFAFGLFFASITVGLLIGSMIGLETPH